MSEHELRDFLASLDADSLTSNEGGKESASKDVAEDGFVIEKTIRVGEGVQLCIEQEGRSALLRIEPGALSGRDSKRPDLSALEQAIVRGIEQLGIVYGCCTENISKALQLARRKEMVRVDVTVAESTRPIDGNPLRVLLLKSDGQNEELVQFNQPMKVPVLKNQKVLRIEEAVPAVAGKNIFGQEIEGAAVEQVRLEIGEHLIAKEHGVYISAVHGELHICDGRAWIIAPDTDAKVELTLENKEMAAYLTITPPVGKGRSVFVSDIQRILKEAGVLFGVQRNIIEAAVQKVLKDKKPLEKLLIAKGQPPILGRAEDVTLTVRAPDFGERYWIKADGSVDFYDLKRIVCVNEGDELAKIEPGIPSKPGRTVLGKIIQPPKPLEPDLIAGAGIRISEDGTRWIASVSGQLHQEGRTVSVHQTFFIDGDLDFSTGNVDFVGDVFIRGDVADGFSVKSGGDITVVGSVGVANLVAKGIIEVGLGISGKNRTTVRCDGNLICSFLQEVKVRCGGDLVAASQILHSDVRVSGVVEVITAKGTIMGGSVIGGRGIRVRQLGSEYETPTEVEVGSDWRKLEEGMKASELEEELAAKLAKLEQLLANVDSAADPNLVARAEGEGEKIRRALEHAKRKKSEARALVFVDPTPSIEVLDTLYSGVSIRIRDARLRVKEIAKGGTISYDDDRGRVSIS